MEDKTTICWLVQNWQNMGSKFFLTVFLIPGGLKKSAKLIMSKQTDQALYSSFFSKTIFWGILTGWEKMKGKTTICWLVENIGSKFFPTVFWSPGGFQQVCEANPLSKIVCSWFVERNRSSALLFIFLKNHVFWDFAILGGWEKMKGKTTISWLVQNFGSKFFTTVFSSLGGS